MEPKPAQTEVAVVGGGIAGLTAACFLAREGAGVTLFEKAPTVGGRAATKESGGFLFNRGIHALYTGGAASRAFEELGVSYGHGTPKETFVLDGGLLRPFPTSPARFLRTDLLGAGDKMALVRFFAGLGRARPKDLAGTSLREWLDAKVRRPRLRRLINSLAYPLVYTSALDLVSAEVFVDKFQRALKHPVHYVDGGWRVLVDGLREVAEGAGARVVNDARVEAVEFGNGRARGVRLRDESVVRASAVVLATGPRDASKLVGGGEHPAFRRLMDRLTPARVACLDVALSRLPSPGVPVVQDLDGPRFMTAQSLYSRVAPGGAALVYTFKQLDPRTPGDPREDERDLEALLDAAQPGWRDVLVDRQYLPRIEAVGALPTAESGGFGGRPGPRVPGLEDLYLAGDWVGPEGFLVDASAASARSAARSVLEDDPSVRREVTAGSVR
ncbi:MAG TPA: NAD(P)/FAD-dependent oxidoreductase [Rubrobacter sp.]|jgi:phytoene dehydrogenase-like protein|nr:NAD(P)/FAD-dependent oxidoreductase [Rubrobacter sp.]